MDKKLFPKFLAATFLILLIASVTAAFTPFAVTEPDGTNDATSGYYTTRWTPFLDDPSHSMLKDVNTVSCYADTANSGFGKAYTPVTNASCCDANHFEFDVWGWVRSKAGTDYYIWCINDQNSDMNAYSGGAMTVQYFAGGDIGLLALDTAGGLLSSITWNIGTVATVLVITLVVLLLVDLVTGTFGIVVKLRDILSR